MWRNVINHAPTIYMNKFNKKPVLTARTADICRRVALCDKNAILEHYTQSIGNQ